MRGCLYSGNCEHLSLQFGVMFKAALAIHSAVTNQVEMTEPVSSPLGSPCSGSVEIKGLIGYQ